MQEENGGSEKIQALKNKLANQSYLDKAVDIIAEQLVYFFYSEWQERDP